MPTGRQRIIARNRARTALAKQGGVRGELKRSTQEAGEGKNQVNPPVVWNQSGKRKEYYIEVNGDRVPVSTRVYGYTPKSTPRIEYFVYVAADFNLSSRIEIAAKNLRALVGKLKRHPHKLYRYGK